MIADVCGVSRASSYTIAGNFLQGSSQYTTWRIVSQEKYFLSGQCANAKVCGSMNAAIRNAVFDN